MSEAERNENQPQAESAEQLPPMELYEEDEWDAVNDFISETFGPCETVFHEILSVALHIDLYIIEPTPEHDFYTLVTMGMGAHRMNVPPELEGQDWDRAELLMCLPKDWNLNDSDERWYWPQRWLKCLAHLPGDEDSWLCLGHTIAYGEPFAENTALCGSVLAWPVDFDGEISCTLPNGELVNFYQVIPLYEDEINFKLENGFEALMERLGACAAVLDIDRPSVCSL